MMWLEFLPWLLLFLFFYTILLSLNKMGRVATGQFLLVTLLIGGIFEYGSSQYGLITGSTFTHRLGGVYLGPIPVLILTSWWVIIHFVMSISERLIKKKQSVMKLVLLDVALAVGLDLVLDPLATKLGVWQWTFPGPFFGVPVGNFLLWAVIVGLTSGLVRTYIYKIKL